MFIIKPKTVEIWIILSMITSQTCMFTWCFDSLCLNHKCTKCQRVERVKFCYNFVSMFVTRTASRLRYYESEVFTVLPVWNYWFQNQLSINIDLVQLSFTRVRVVSDCVVYFIRLDFLSSLWFWFSIWILLVFFYQWLIWTLMRRKYKDHIAPKMHWQTFSDGCCREC